MPRLKVREVAQAQGKTISTLQLDVRLPMATVRRYWYGTSNGKTEGKTLTEVDLTKLSVIAKALEVKIADLIEEELAPPATAISVVKARTRVQLQG